MPVLVVTCTEDDFGLVFIPDSLEDLSTLSSDGISQAVPQSSSKYTWDYTFRMCLCDILVIQQRRPKAPAACFIQLGLYGLVP